MMSFDSIVKKRLDYIFYLAIVLGLIFPTQTSFLNSYAIIFIGIAMFFIFLKVDFSKMTDYIKRPILLAYIVVVFLVIIPTIIFLGTTMIDPIYAVGFLLIFGGPIAATGAVIVDLLKGNTSFALLITFLLYVLSPITLPLLSFYLAGSIIAIDVYGLFITMFQMMVIPMILAQVVKRYVNVKNMESHTSTVTIIMLALTALGIMGAKSVFILSNLYSVLFFMVILYALYGVVAVTTYYMAFWLNKKDRLTISISKTFMNGTLTLVIASQFFGPEATLVVLSNIIVWYSSLGLAKRFIK